MEYQGRDVAQAIAAACSDLKVPQEQLNIDIQSTGSSGIFGLGKKKATITVSLKSSREYEKVDAAREFHGGKRKNFKGNQRRRMDRDKPCVTLSPEQLDNIRDHLATILERMGYPSNVDITQANNKIHGHITGDYVDDIVGPEGQTLDGLQYLLRKIISRNVEGKVMFSLDAGDYRDRRRKDLEERAAQLAKEVKDNGKTKSIPSLNPAERRIVHMILQNDTQIRSRSVGEGHFKKILIYKPGKNKRK